MMPLKIVYLTEKMDYLTILIEWLNEEECHEY